MDAIDLIVELGHIFDALDIPWVLGGSMASSVSGEPRATMDVDLAIRLETDRIELLFAAVESTYYTSISMIRAAVDTGSSFNLIRLTDIMKADIFVLGDSTLDDRQISRRQIATVVGVSGPVDIWVGSPEDQVLRKLWWYRLGGEVSDRQWRDVLGILKVQKHTIDVNDIVSVARSIGLGDIAQRAIAEAGLKE